MATPINLGAAQFSFRGDPRNLQKGTQTANRSLRNHRRSLRQTQNSYRQTARTAQTFVSRIGGVAGALGVGLAGAGLAQGIKQLASLGATLVETARSADISVEALQNLRFVAQSDGVGADQLDRALLRLNRTLGDAQLGSSSAAEAFANLGLEVETITNLRGEDRFIAIAEAISNLEDRTLQTAAAQAIFGRAGQDLLPVLIQTGDQIRNTVERSEELGNVTERNSQALKDLDQSFADFAKSAEANAANALGFIIRQFQEISREVNTLEDNLRDPEQIRLVDDAVASLAESYRRNQEAVEANNRASSEYFQSLRDGTESLLRFGVTANETDTEVEKLRNQLENTRNALANLDDSTRSSRDEASFYQAEIVRLETEIARLEASSRSMVQVNDEVVASFGFAGRAIQDYNELANQMADANNRAADSHTNLRNQIMTTTEVAREAAQQIDSISTTDTSGNTAIERALNNQLVNQRRRNEALQRQLDEQRRAQREADRRVPIPRATPILDETIPSRDQENAQRNRLRREAEERRRVERVMRRQAEAAREIERANEQAARTTRDLFNDIAAGGDRARSAYIRLGLSILENLIAPAKMAQGEVSILNQLLGGIFGGSGGLGGLDRIINFGGFRQRGGPVAAGRSYVVGEGGPELLVSGGAGNIVPNNRLGSGININIPITVPADAPAIRRAARDLVPAIQRVAEDAVITALSGGPTQMQDAVRRAR